MTSNNSACNLGLLESPSDMKESLFLKNLSLRRNGRLVLDSINLSLKKGRLLLLTGPSGSGKTSLAQVISGVIPQHYSGEISGEIWIDGCPALTHSIEELSRSVVCVFSDCWHRFFQITVAEELAFGPVNLGFSSDEIDQIVRDTAEMFDLVSLLESRIDRLSGGQLQRVLLAAAVTMKPRYLVLDEPSSSLDRSAIGMLRCCLEMIIKTQHTGILLLEHRLTDFLDITDEIAVINRGSCVFHGSVSEYTAKSHHLAYATGIRFPGQRHPEDWKEHLDPIVPGEVTPIFTLEDVTAGFESSCLNSLNCSIYPGITALTGPNGSGKSTLAALLAGLITPVRGSISWSGHIKAPRLPDGRVVGLLQQDAAGMMFTNSVFSEISEGLCNYSVPSAAARVKHWLRIIDLSDASGCHPLQLSTGQIVRVATAAVMALQPRILILDEPSRGQDWEHFQTLLHQCVSCHQNAPESCIIITHDYKVIHRFAQWVIVLDQGKIVTQGKLRKYCYEN